MPKFDVHATNNHESELSLKPSDGDVKIEYGQLCQYLNGYWNQIGNIDQLFQDVNRSKSDMISMERWQFKHSEQHKQAKIEYKLAEEFDELYEAGEYLKMLRLMSYKAEKSYEALVEKYKEQSEIWKILKDEKEVIDDIPF